MLKWRWLLWLPECFPGKPLLPTYLCRQLYDIYSFVSANPRPCLLQFFPVLFVGYMYYKCVVLFCHSLLLTPPSFSASGRLLVHHNCYVSDVICICLFDPCKALNFTTSAEPGYALSLQTVYIQIQKPTDLDLHCLSLSMWIYSTNPDQVIWLTEN